MIRLSPSSFIAGVILGVLLAGAWVFRDSVDFSRTPSQLLNATSPAQDQISGETRTGHISNTSGAIEIGDQLAGDTVFVGSVTVPPPGVWVAVREVSQGGSDLGNVLGAARVTGPRSNITVILLRATEPSRTYAVELYRDDNRGAFDPGVNSVYVDFDTGARVVSYFATKP